MFCLDYYFTIKRCDFLYRAISTTVGFNSLIKRRLSQTEKTEALKTKEVFGYSCDNYNYLSYIALSRYKYFNNIS